MVNESQFLSITRFWTSVRAVTLSLSSCSSLKTLIASQRYCPLGGRYLFSTLSINSFVMLILKSSGMSMGFTFLRLTWGGGLQETIDSSVGLGLPLWLDASDRRPQGSRKFVIIVEISPTCSCQVSVSRLSAIKTPAMFGFLIKFLLYSFSAWVIRVQKMFSQPSGPTNFFRKLCSQQLSSPTLFASLRIKEESMMTYWALLYLKMSRNKSISTGNSISWQYF